jgi:hypothetical protein
MAITGRLFQGNSLNSTAVLPVVGHSAVPFFQFVDPFVVKRWVFILSVLDEKRARCVALV